MEDVLFENSHPLTCVTPYYSQSGNVLVSSAWRAVTMQKGIAIFWFCFSFVVITSSPTFSGYNYITGKRKMSGFFYTVLLLSKQILAFRSSNLYGIEKIRNESTSNPSPCSFLTYIIFFLVACVFLGDGTKDVLQDIVSDACFPRWMHRRSEDQSKCHSFVFQKPPCQLSSFKSHSGYKTNTSLASVGTLSLLWKELVEVVISGPLLQSTAKPWDL